MSIHTDKRTIAARSPDELRLEVDEDKMKADVFIPGEGKIGTVTVEYEVCGLCQGKGTHVNPSIDSQGIPSHRFREDPEFAERYFGGTYDQQCNKCDGKRVVPRPDPRSEDEEEVMEQYIEAVEREKEYQMQRAAERRMGA